MAIFPHEGDGWTEVTAVRITGESVLITVADGRVFRAGYMNALLSRKTPPREWDERARQA
jgi:hypothetical protein